MFKHYRCAVRFCLFVFCESYSCYICYKSISFLDVIQNGSFTLEGHLNAQVTSPVARFGFTVASIGDVNGDGYEDIAVGAPLEDQLSISSSFGSIYIFNGDKDKIKSSFSQVRVFLGITSTTPREGRACVFVEDARRKDFHILFALMGEKFADVRWFI